MHIHIIFVIFAPRTIFLFIFCSTQKCENRNKMNFASKQRKSLQKSIHCKFVTCRKVCYKEQFVIDLQSQNYSTQQTILSCGARLLVMESNVVPHDHQQFSCRAKLLHMKFFAPRTMSAASATNMMYVHLLMCLLPNVQVCQQQQVHKSWRSIKSPFTCFALACPALPGQTV